MRKLSGNMHVEVYKAWSNRPIQRVKYSFAARLVSDGNAQFIGDRAIQLIPRSIAVVSSPLVKSNQGDAYELSAIEKNPRYFCGGLVRTEHQPLRIQKCKGARVGHQ